jgi:hypothetical protein
MNLDSFYGSGPELNAEKSIEMSGVKETLNSAIKKVTTEACEWKEIGNYVEPAEFSSAERGKN